MRFFRQQTIQLILTLLLLVGWLGDGWSLYDIGDRSITVLFIAGFFFLIYCLLYRRVPQKLAALVALQIFSGVLAVLVAMIAGQDRAVSNLMQQLLATAVLLGVATFDWSTLLPRLEVTMLCLAVPTCAYGVYQLAARAQGLPYAFLPMNNIQQLADKSYQRTYGDRFHIRASSVFVEPSDFGYFCCWLVCLGLGTDNKLRRTLFLTLAFVGVLVAQSLGAMICITLLLLIYFIRLGKLGPVFVSAIAGVTALFVASYLFPAQTNKFVDRIIQASHFDEAADSDRVNRVPQNTEVILDAPIIGHGLASWRTWSPGGVANGIYDLLEERGVVGSLLFLIPYFVILGDCLLAPAARKNPLDTTRLLFAVLNLYTFLTFAMIYFLPFWFAMGLSYRKREKQTSPLKQLRRAYPIQGSAVSASDAYR